MERVHVKVYGYVHGVLYRAKAVDEAKKLGLVGWIRNVSDGSVELVAEGEADALDSLVEWCRAGPAFAQVKRVETQRQKATGEFRDFEVRH